MRNILGTGLTCMCWRSAILIGLIISFYMNGMVGVTAVIVLSAILYKTGFRDKISAKVLTLTDTQKLDYCIAVTTTAAVITVLVCTVIHFTIKAIA